MVGSRLLVVKSEGGEENVVKRCSMAVKSEVQVKSRAVVKSGGGVEEQYKRDQDWIG
jgi:hypothetical protein